ncbi:MAG: peptidoglycan bridge formation glycyltransferase FemA/FemB family protein, partial [Chloroflexi bacterium]|nr:peptidoglycan bridge formation glycyltransferase FemA/FemB family protein [Chloroflexota bacterium]
MQVSMVQVDGRWDGWLQELPSAHALQSSGWAEFKAGYGWQPQALRLHEGEQTQALALLLVRRLRGLPWGVGYVPKGPCLRDPDRLDLWQDVLAALERLARRERLLFVKIDPDVERPADDEIAPLPQLLGQRGWQASAEQVQFRNTVLLDLTPEPEALLEAMHPKTRYNIRLAARRGVTVRPGTGSDLPAFYHLYQTTSQRDGFLIRPYAYYRDL